MRSDFSKVLTERPRSSSRVRYKNVRNRMTRKTIDEDEQGHAEGMRFPYGYEQKGFTDLIGPLYRFLHSRVGKPWDKVHSEICSALKGRSTQQQHLLDHVESAVISDLSFENGKLVHANGLEFIRRYWGFANRTFYVDPRDGTLKAVTEKMRRQWARKPAKREVDELQTKDGKTFRRVVGIWYNIKITTTYVSVIVGFKGEEAIRKVVPQVQEVKRQLGTAELRKRGLVNKALVAKR